MKGFTLCMQCKSVTKILLYKYYNNITHTHIQILEKYKMLQMFVSAVSLSPHGDGQYLMTGSFDRSIKFWDLEDSSTPITVNRKGSVTDGAWLTHWGSAINSMDDSYL